MSSVIVNTKSGDRFKVRGHDLEIMPLPPTVDSESLEENFVNDALKRSESMYMKKVPTIPFAGVLGAVNSIQKGDMPNEQGLLSIFKTLKFIPENQAISLIRGVLMKKSERNMKEDLNRTGPMSSPELPVPRAAEVVLVMDYSDARKNKLNAELLAKAPATIEVIQVAHSERVKVIMPEDFNKKKHMAFIILFGADKKVLKGSETGSSDGVFDSTDDRGEKVSLWRKAYYAQIWAAEKKHTATTVLFKSNPIVLGRYL